MMIVRRSEVLSTLLLFCALFEQSYASKTSPNFQSHTFSSEFDAIESTGNYTSASRIRGWVEQPNRRGTFDILWTCLVTIGISTYTMLCLNVPGPNDSYKKIIGRRVLWMLLGILGPEFVLTYAAGQWSRAKWSVKAFHDSGHDDWHMRQAFFADMGGFVLHTADGKPFPLNATQLHWLVHHRHIEYPKISEQEIWDKSKQDTFTKAVTAFQVSYLVVQCIARAAQGLAITTLELNALAIVVCSLMTSYAWLHKPADVHAPVHLHSARPLEEMIGNLKWELTPLDHVDLNGPGYSVNVQPFMKMPVIPADRPIQRIPDDRFPMNPYGVQEYLLCFATLLFTAIHVAGWNFDFPTATERLLWRVSSLVLFGITVAFWVFETVASWTRLGRWKALYLFFVGRDALKNHRARMRHRQTLKPERKMSELPLVWEFALIAPMAIVYGIARLYLIAEAFAELRDINASAYVSVEWADFIPHI